MSITLYFTKGKRMGQKNVYTEKEQVILGRQDDCNLIIPDGTVSRYHCMLDILPPRIRVRDFGSKNGTYVNGEKIGQRPTNASAEEGRAMSYAMRDLQNGDMLGLGANCELSVSITDDSATLGDQDAAAQPTPNGGVGLEDTPRCEGCGKALSQDEQSEPFCKACRDNPLQLLNRLLDDAMRGSVELGGLRGYKTIRMIGEGATASVYEVVSDTTGEKRALKLLMPQVAVLKRAQLRFEREALIMSKLHHPHIIHQYENGCSGSAFYILMEFCEGGDVEALMRRHGGTLPVALATELILQTLDGLDYAHHAEVQVRLEDGELVTAGQLVHRDIKPGNLLLMDTSNHPTVKIADFGLAKALETAGLTGVTFGNTQAGTPEFASRWQIKDFRFAKPEVDVWSTAATYYYMLTGKTPRRDDGGDVWASMLSGETVPVLQRNPAIPVALAAVVDEALLEMPEIRIKTARELKQRIEAAI